MAGETVITVVGTLTAAPELRFTPSGAEVANFTIASNARTFDKQTNSWKDQGRLRQRSYEKDGQKRTVMELEVDEIGASMKFATVKVQKAERSGGQARNSSAVPDPYADEAPF